MCDFQFEQIKQKFKIMNFHIKMFIIFFIALAATESKVLIFSRFFNFLILLLFSLCLFMLKKVLISEELEESKEFQQLIDLEESTICITVSNFYEKEIKKKIK